MNNTAQVTPATQLACHSPDGARLLDIAANSTNRASGALQQRLALVLDGISCGVLLCAGQSVVYRNRAACLAMQAGGIRGEGAPQEAMSLPIDADTIGDLLRCARLAGSRRVLSLGGGDPGFVAAVVPLVHDNATAHDLTLVFLGPKSLCDELSAYAEGFLHEITQFLVGMGRAPAPERALLTMLFADIVGSTKRAEELGDESWQRLLARYHAIVLRHLADFGGREVDTAGDGFFATFDGPARGLRCAQAIRDSVRAIGIEIRAGLHAGECEIAGGRVVGVAVHVAARVAKTAGTGEILVSSTVRDLVAGSGLNFSGGDWYALKGLRDKWRLFALCGATR